MALKVYGSPEGFEPPSFDLYHTLGRDGYLEAEKSYVRQVVDWCKINGNGEFRGERLDFPVADGLASYIVYTEKPLALLHVELGDAYRFEYVTRLTLTDVRKQVEQRRALAALFGRA